MVQNICSPSVATCVLQSLFLQMLKPEQLTAACDKFAGKATCGCLRITKSLLKHDKYSPPSITVSAGDKSVYRGYFIQWDENGEENVVDGTETTGKHSTDRDTPQRKHLQA